MKVQVVEDDGLRSWHVVCPVCGGQVLLQEGSQPSGTNVEQFLAKELDVHMAGHDRSQDPAAKSRP